MRRMPRTFKHLDYAVPAGWTLARGAFVLIPFRKQKVIGIVKRVKDVPLRGIVLKPLISVFTQMALKETELAFFELNADAIAQSVCSLLYTSLPQPPKRLSTRPVPSVSRTPLSIPASESSTVARVAFQMGQRRSAFISVSDLRRTAALISRYLYLHPGEKSIIVCPSVRDAIMLSSVFASHDCLCVTGEETNNERFAIWQMFRKQTHGLLIVTRAAVFYADAQTSTVFVVRATQDSHAQHDRNPRIDSRKVMHAFSIHFTTNLYFFDVQPTVTDLVQFQKEHLLNFPTNPATVWIDATKERPVSPHPLICSSTIEYLTQNLASLRRVLLIYNKKGFASRLCCQTCQHVCVCSVCSRVIAVLESAIVCPSCKTMNPIPLRCPSCQSSAIKKMGYGDQQLAAVLQKWFPDKRVQIVDAEHPTFDPAVEITLGTQYFFENHVDPFQSPHFGCVIHLDPDTPLFSSDFRATQKAILRISQWAGFAHANQALLVIQTDQVKLFHTFFEDPLLWLTQEENVRKTYAQPPFEEWMRVWIEEPERRKCELEAHLLVKALQAIPGVHVRAEEPSKQTQNASFVVCVTPESLPALLSFFSTLDDHYLIDRHAFS